MSKSPGHQKFPRHHIAEKHLEERVKVTVADATLADSADVLRLDEDHNPTRYYFPRSDVRMDQLERSSTTSECPFKGTAHYFNLKLGTRKIPDAVWSYEDPYEEHLALKGRLAFYDDRIPEFHIEPKV